MCMVIAITWENLTADLCKIGAYSPLYSENDLLRLEGEETDHMATHIRNLIMFITVLIAPFNMVQADPEGQHELLFFLNANHAHNNFTSEEGQQYDDIVLSADVIYGYVKGDFRFLTEYILSTYESELERLQLGWQINDNDIGWLGRFHSPASYWNIAYHHGQYLQTSITRPLIARFEDEEGIVPAHVTGVMLETMHDLQGSDSFQTTISFGKTSVIGDLELVPFDLLDLSSKHSEAVDIRLAYLPDQFGDNQFGLLLKWSDLVVDDSPVAELQGLEKVEQGVIGAYVDWRIRDWKVLANLSYINNEMIKQAQDQTDVFFAAYFQAEYVFHPQWTVFGRVEDTPGARDSEYLELFPASIIERQMLGLRFDFYRNNALTLEISNVATQTIDSDQLWFQWSAVLP